ncbi:MULTISPECIES: (2Fe-2S)-binding protein [Paraburkholderia]|uniref:2Fe-2S iron-sulfur cluster binding domain-containing protein n=2 Tax=Paraburkholderia tropica TaxID=92647 RepID=A0AAQ1JTB1_9BURK|nr:MULTISPECIES: (2Fe-2S)-binding protein [Paraburkholderia]MBB2978905.1 putative molibdopterin-dependent oxidoreductase YjgC [Paraburkholderia tropica]MBB2999265.1 putative molibdopterin-dependent oxidoreductase YjgC [Paraburkholderia tropica]MBB6318835.1 putative molibdopterin-dependent oxidoreductase YjgC [Paraburkholderia tropica]MDE1138992.1 (2Fe-2S)-binding protein [Paraburkholderia tropica]PXX18638.1 2Fe-2S iron-sulfur cluster protein [Paraburkholderia tropica]
MASDDGMHVHGLRAAPCVELIYDGRPVSARDGESVAAALFAAGIRRLRTSPRAHGARGMFCLMGSCQECLVMVDGRRALACQTPVRAQMRVETVDLDKGPARHE